MLCASLACSAVKKDFFNNPSAIFPRVSALKELNICVVGNIHYEPLSFLILWQEGKLPVNTRLQKVLSLVATIKMRNANESLTARNHYKFHIGPETLYL